MSVVRFSGRVAKPIAAAIKRTCSDGNDMHRNAAQITVCADARTVTFASSGSGVTTWATVDAEEASWDGVHVVDCGDLAKALTAAKAKETLTLTAADTGWTLQVGDGIEGRQLGAGRTRPAQHWAGPPAEWIADQDWTAAADGLDLAALRDLEPVTSRPKDGRPILECVELATDGAMAATDSYQLHVRHRPPLGNRDDLLVRPEWWRPVLMAAGKGRTDPVRFASTTDGGWVHAGWIDRTRGMTWCLIGATSDQQFANWRPLVPDMDAMVCAYRIGADGVESLAALAKRAKRAGLADCPVVLSAEGPDRAIHATIQFQGATAHDATGPLVAERIGTAEGKRLVSAWVPMRLVAALGPAGGTLHIETPLRPGAVRPGGDDLNLLMPVRLPA